MPYVETSFRVTRCPDQLSPEHLDQFREVGYVAFDNVLTGAEVEAARSALTEITIRLMKKAQRGIAEVRVKPNAPKNCDGPEVIDPDTGFAVNFESGIDPLALSFEESELKIRKLHGYSQEHATFISMTQHPRINGFIEQILQEEAILQGDIALVKPPFIGSEKPWHQDNAYFHCLPLEKVATVWIALDDSTIENGCMHVLPGGHTLGALKHHHTVDCEILSDRIEKDRAVAVELKAGGVMYFSAMLPHQTPPNRTADRRRALQFQYRGVSTKQVSKEEYGKVFAEADGTPASCALAHENG